MGLFHNIFLGVFHLLFTAIDLLFVLVFLKILYEHRRISCMEPIITAVDPLVYLVLNKFERFLYRITGKSYPQKTILILFVFFLLVFRLIAIGMVKGTFP